MTGLELGMTRLNAPGMARIVGKGKCTMSLSLRPVVEKWRPSYGFLLGHEEMVDLLRQIAALAGIDSHCQHGYAQLQNQYHDGTTERSQLAQTSRHTFRLVQRLTAAAVIAGALLLHQA